MVTTIIIFLITLLVLVLSHEFGHFIMAKKFGVKVLEFGLGLPPKIWSKKIGETLCSLNLLPIGGFVRLFGEDEVDKEVLTNNRSFASKPVWQRIVIVIAGVTMNLLLASVLFWIVLAAKGFQESIPLLTPHKFIGVNQVNEFVVIIGNVAVDSPASKAGIKSGDRVVEFNFEKVDDSSKLVNQIKQNAGKNVTLILEDQQNTKRTVEITPRLNPPIGQGSMGVELGSYSVANISYPRLEQKLGAGLIRSYNLISYSLDILGNLISQSIKTRDIGPVSKSVAGPVGITNMTNSILQTESPLIPYLDFVGLLSLNLAIVNILPFPALDGGRLVFLLSEAIFKRKVRVEIERAIHTVGMVLLIGLIMVITFSDIRKLF